MIKINLANPKQAAYVGGSGKTGVGQSFLNSFRDSGSDWMPVLKKAGLPLFLCFAASYGFDYYTQTMDEEMLQEIATLEKEKDQIGRELQKIKGFEGVKVELERNELVLRAKIDTIEKLIRGRDYTVKTLIYFAQSVPKDVWMSGFTGTEKNYDIRGSTMDIGLISDFMAALGRSIYFKDITLKSTQTDPNGRQAGFELSARRE